MRVNKFKQDIFGVIGIPYSSLTYGSSRNKYNKYKEDKSDYGKHITPDKFFGKTVVFHVTPLFVIV